MGVYLPMALTFLIVVGTVLGHYYDKWADARKDPEAAKRMGVLAATGLIVGESLFGVAFAGIVAGSGSDAPLARYRRRRLRPYRRIWRRGPVYRHPMVDIPPHTA
jgi:hypothetical protein